MCTFIGLPSHTVGVLNREMGLFTIVSLCPTPYGCWHVGKLPRRFANGRTRRKTANDNG